MQEKIIKKKKSKRRVYINGVFQLEICDLDVPKKLQK